MRRVVLLSALVALAVAMLAPARASAGSNFPFFNGPIQNVPVTDPQDVVYDYYGDFAWVLSRGVPPTIRHYEIHGDGRWEFIGDTNLGPTDDPTFIDWTEDGDLVVGDDEHGEYLFFDAGTGEYLGSEPYGVGTEFLNGLANAFFASVVSDFGTDSEPGSLWIGSHRSFLMELAFGDQIHPNGVDLLPDYRKAKLRKLIVSLILLIDAQNSDILELSDSADPQVLDTLPGPPGATGAFPPRDIVVFPINWQANDLKPARHVVGVPDPSLHRIYLSEGPDGPWALAYQKDLGRPVRMDANCKQAAATYFDADVVRIFRLRSPRGSECEELVDVVATGGGGSAFGLALKPYFDGSASTRISFALPGRDADDKRVGTSAARAATRVRTGAKSLKVTAGHIKHFRLRLSPRAARRLAAALSQYHHVGGTIKVRVRNHAGRKAVVKRRIRLRQR